MGIVHAESNKGPKVWGLHGESWNRDLLLDWSYSGYAGKERGYPEPSFGANVLDFGAVGDGVVDCTGPFLAAIDKVSKHGGGTILIPAGKYLLKERLIMSGNNIVLKGQGTEKTKLYYEHPLSSYDDFDVEGHLEKGFQQSPYSWHDGVIQIVGHDRGSRDNSKISHGWVVEPSKIGQRHLVLDSVDGLVPGQWVRLIQSDVGGSLASHLYGTDFDKISLLKTTADDCEPQCASDISNEQDLVKWVSRILEIQNGNVVVLQRSLPMDVLPKWKSRILPMPDSMPKESGVRDLTLEFAWASAGKHHHDQGYNGILIQNAVNAFVYNVHTINAHQGFLVKNSQMISLDSIKVGRTKSRRSKSMPWDGHIGIGLYDSSDVEVAGFDIRGEWLHDISVRGCLMSVFHSGRGDNLRIDTHRSAPYAILFSDIYVGEGTRTFGTGGFLSRGLPVAKYTTYYNIRNKKQSPIQLPASTVAGPCTWGKLVNYIGKWSGNKCPGYHVELITKSQVYPKDLYNAMMQRKVETRNEFPTGVIPASQSRLAKTTTSSDQPPRIFPAGDGSYPVVHYPERY